ncbi:hypothetical protein LSM04_009579 [Trypanosoma melophagium]|uniref:uncharacterized protein n=1 Tax=Trypanosoma melophagium TaxID=715481 RepID=UPI00351A8F73|nr:hypothetical protein LSM04_009579 [Trypanosoma melophagium]
MLHLRESYYDSLLLLGLHADPFVSTGGESLQEPEFGASLYLDGKQYLLSPLQAEDGRFARNNKTFHLYCVQYFAISIYSPNTQNAVINLRYNTTTRVYFDGNIVFEEQTFLPRNGYSSVFLMTEGWHQIIVKVGFSYLGRTTPEMSIRFENARSLSWSCVKDAGNTTDCENGNKTTALYTGPNVTVSYEDCMELGCCYDELNPIKSFSVGTPDPNGIADCYLSYGECSLTVEDPRASETYLRLSDECGMTNPVNGNCTEDSGSFTLYGNDIDKGSCLYGCSMTAECAVAVYNRERRTCMFSSTNCTAT